MSTLVISVEEVCQTLGCGRRRVFQLLAEGILERAPRYGRALRIFKASVERALLSPPTPERKKRRKAVSAVGLIGPDDVDI